MTVVLWDALGTLLDLEPVRAPFTALGRPHGLEAWIVRVLHTGVALSLAGEFHPFAELAESTLATALAQLGLPPDEAGIESWIVTNGGRESTEQALARGELEGRVRGIVSIDDVEVWKPAAAAYEEALRRANVEPGDAWLIAAHAWDVRGAGRHGLNAVWVERLEQAWPLPDEPLEHHAPDLTAAARLVPS